MKSLLAIAVFLVLSELGSAVTVPLTGASHSYKANEFYIGFMQNEYTVQRSPTVLLFIATDELHTVTFSVTSINPKFAFVGEVSFKNVTIVELPGELVVTVDRTNPEKEKTKGIHVKAENGKMISVVGSNKEHATTDSFTALPLIENPLLVRERYTILSNDYIRISNNQVLVYSEFLLVGSRNGTKVVITPNNTNLEIPSIYDPDRRYVAAGEKVELTLNSMETLLITSINDLSGTVISSSEPISVFTGHECGQVPAVVTTCDHLVEQVPPQHTWGMQFFTAPLKRESGDLFKIVTINTPLTEVNITCTEMQGKEYYNSTFRTLSLGRSEVYSFEQGPHDYCCIESTNPLLVMQLGKGSSLNSGLGDPLLVTIPAAQQYTNNFTVIQDQSSSHHYLNVIVPVRYFNNTPQGHSRISINNVTASRSWSPIFCSTGQICAYGTQTRLEDNFATVIHEDPEAGMSVTVYGLGVDVAYGYSAGYNLDPIAFPIVSLEPGESSVRGISDNVTLAITRRGNIRIPLLFHLISDVLDSDGPVSEVHLLPGEVRKEVNIPIMTGLLPIATEIITIVLSYSGNEKVLLVNTEANITILEALKVGFDNSSVIVSEGVGMVSLMITASIPNPEPSPIKFKIRTLAETARDGEDYRGVDDIITLFPLEQTIQYQVTIIDDNVVEEKMEMFSVIFEIAPGQEKVGGLTLEQFMAQVFIQDDDCVAIYLEPTNLILNESSGVAVITVHKIGLSNLTTTVYVNTKDISTSVQVDYELLSGTTVVFQPEDTERNIYITVVDDDVLEGDEQFLLQLLFPEDQLLLCHNQSTASDIATVTIFNDDVLRFHFDRAYYSTHEDSGLIILTVIKEGYHKVSITVELYTHSQSSGNSAIDGADYNGVRKNLTFDAGLTNQSITITIIDDDITEGMEYFTASLFSSETGVQISSPKDTIIAIVDNDAVDIGLNKKVYSVSEGEGEITVAVRSEGLLGHKVEVLFSTKDGSATNSSDYSELFQILEFGPGVGVVEVVIPILADNSYELLESFTVELQLLDQSTSGIRIESGRGMARVDIIDDDIAVGFASREYTASESDESVILYIIKQGQVKKKVDIHYEIKPAHNHPPNESTSIVSTGYQSVTLDEDDTTQLLVLHLIDDNLVEADEIVQVKLTVVGQSAGIELVNDTAMVTITNDDEAIVQFSVQNVTISESEGLVVLQILKVGLTSVPLTVMFTTIGNQATDYIPKQEEVTFEPNETQRSVAVDIIDDAIYEGIETFMVALRAVSPGVAVERSPSWITILDNDDFVALRFVPMQVMVCELEEFVQITVSKVGQSVVPVVVMVATQDSTAMAGADYIPIAMEITFVPEDIDISFNITILSDQVLENAERFDLVMSVMDHIGRFKVLDRQSVIIIDSSSSLNVTLGSDRRVVTENEGNITFNVEMIGHLERDITLQFFTEDIDASAGDDYKSTRFSLTLTPDQQVFSINVPIFNDDIVEGRETFTAKLTSSHEQVTLVNSSVTATILDDDKVSVKFNRLEYSVNEDESVAVLLVRKEGQNEIPIHITVSTEDGSAIKQMDYVPVTSVLTFERNDFEVSVNVSIKNDEVLEDIEVFHVLLSSAAAESKSVFLDSYNASVMIVDQDLIYLGFSQDELFVDEAGGVVMLMLVKEGYSEIEAHVEFHLKDVSTAESIDYTYTSQVIVFHPEDAIRYINISIVDDDLLEGTERFIVTLRLVSDQVGVHLINNRFFISIRDDDYVSLRFGRTNISVVEDYGMVDLTILKEGVATIPVNVVITGQENTAQLNEDYLDYSKTLVIEPDQTIVILTIQILNDNILEENESFTVQLEAGEHVRILDDVATIQIVDDDVAQVGFNNSEYIIPEGSGRAEICIQTSIEVDIQFSVFVAGKPLSASLSTDFTVVTSQVVIGDHERGTQCALIDIVDDLTTEDVEAFQLQLYLKNNTLETGSGGQIALSPDTTTIFIIDNDRIHIGFEFVSYVVSEGEHSADVCAVVKSGTIQNVSIQVDAFAMSETAEIDEDFAVGNLTLVFSEASLRQCVIVTIADDSIIEMDETLLIELMPHYRYELLQESAAISIKDNDDIRIRFAQSAYSVTEGEGQITLEVLLQQPALPSFPISVTVQVDSNETDTLADWNIERSTYTLDDVNLFLPVIIYSDNKIESNESFFLTIYPSDPRPGFKTTQEEAVITILDDDYATLSFESSSYNTSEDIGMLELSVVMVKGMLERDIYANIFTSAMDAQPLEDFIVIDSFIKFSAGARSGDTQSISVRILDDQIVEIDEQFSIELVSVDNAVQFAKKSSQITILDNDVISVSFISRSHSVIEGEQAEVCLMLEGGCLNRVVQLLVTNQPESASFGEDYYTPAAMFYVALKPGQNQTCFTITTIEDNLVEGQETFQLTLSSDIGVLVVFSYGTTSVLIEDDDIAVFGFEAAMYTVTEDNDLIVPVRLIQNELVKPILLALKASDISATAEVDYSHPTLQLLFEVGTKPGSYKNASVTIYPDTVVENHESFLLALISLTPLARIEEERNTTIAIIQDISTITIGFETTRYYLREGTLHLTVCLRIQEGKVDRALNFTLSARSGTAQAIADYSDLVVTDFFTPENDQKCVDFGITDDSLVEVNETFTLFLKAMEYSTSVSPNEATVTIIDNDKITLAMRPSHITVQESIGEVEISLELTGTLQREVAIMLESMDGTASFLRGDYLQFSEMLVFPPGSETGTTISFNIRIEDDHLVEEMQYFTVHATSMDKAVQFEPQRDNVTVYIEDNDVIGVMLESASYLLSENGTVKVCMMPIGRLEREVQLSLVSLPGSAQENEDYVSIKNKLTVHPGDDRICFYVESLDDHLVEGDETIQLLLSANDPAVTTPSVNIITITIKDDDNAVFGLENPEYIVGENESNLTIAVQLVLNELASPVQLKILSSDISAINREDYVFVPTTVTFQSGSRPGEVQYVSITILSDNKVEYTKIFQLMLYSISPLATINEGMRNSSVKIADQSYVMIGFEQTLYYAQEGIAQQEVCIVIQGGSLARSVDLSVSNSDGTAQAPGDYLKTLHLNTYSHTDGERKCFNVTIMDDDIVENNETFYLALFSKDPAFSLISSRTAVVITDNDEVMLTLQETNYTVNESVGLVEIKVELEGKLERDVTLSMKSNDGTALALSRDYSPLSETLTFYTGSETTNLLSVYVSIHDDLKVEGKESFTIQAMSTDVAVIFKNERDTVFIFIEDDDMIIVNFISTPYSVTEGETVEVCLTLERGLLERSVQLSLLSKDDTAQLEYDYTALISSISLSPDISQWCFNVSTLGDSVVEGEEVFQVVLMSSDPAVITLTPLTTLIYIQDSNIAVFGVEFSQYTVNENAEELLVNVVLLESELAFPVLLHLSPSDISAVNNKDYRMLMPVQVEFQTRSKPDDKANISIAILPDNEIEIQETFRVTLLSSSPLVSIMEELASAIITINDISSISVGFEEGKYYVHEEDSTLEVCVNSHGGQLSRPLNLTFISNDGSASAPGDYSKLFFTMTLFGSSTEKLCINVTIIDDLFLEDNENFTLLLTSADQAVSIELNTTSVTILDNDEVTLVLQPSHLTVNESSQYAEVTIQLTGNVEREVSFILESADGMASFAGDYKGISSRLMFPHGSISGSILTVNITIVDDLYLEEVEYFTVYAFSMDSGVHFKPERNSTLIFIEDNDFVKVMLESASYSVPEGGTVEVCVIVDSQHLEKTVHLSVATVHVSAQESYDYAPIVSTLILLSGENSTCFSIETFDDDIVEEDEIFEVLLSSEDKAVDTSALETVVISIRDSDRAIFGLELFQHFIEENDEGFVVSVLLLEKTLAVPVSLQLTTTDVTARIDYVSSSKLVNFQSGSKPGDSKNISVATPLSDNVVELTESFQIHLISLTSMAHVRSSLECATVSITDRNSVAIGFEDSSYYVTENENQIEVCIVLRTGHLDRSVSLVLSTHSKSAHAPRDYTEVMFETMFNGARTCIDIIIVDDNIVEDNELFLLILNSTDVSVMFNLPIIAVTIVDNDYTTIEFLMTQLTVSESSEYLDLIITLNGSIERNVTLRVESQNRTASSGSDYTAIKQTLIFTAGGVVGSTLLLRVDIKNDNIVEQQEYFTIHMMSSDLAINMNESKKNVTIFIQDDDNISVRLTSASYSVAEGETATLCAELEAGQSDREVELSILSLPGSAQEEDYTMNVLILSLGSAQNQSCFQVNILRDNLVEEEETFSLILTSEDPAVITSTPDSSTVYIEDINDVVMEFELTEYFVNESDGSLTVSVVLQNIELRMPISVLLATEDMTATNQVDYVFMDTTLIFPSGSKSGHIKNITFMILSDKLIENTEFFQLYLSHVGQHSVIKNISSAKVQIYDQTVVNVAFETSEYSVHEGKPLLEVCILIEGGQLDRPVDIKLFSTDRTAFAQLDYVNLSATKFETDVGNIMCRNVSVIDDLLLERNETFTLVLLSNDTAVHISHQTATVVIIDDDQVTFGFSHNTYTASEGKGQLEISIQLLGGQGLEKDVTVYLESSNENTTASTDDYMHFRKALTFPQGSLPNTTLSVLIDILDDDLVEEIEYFTVHMESTDIDSAVQSQINATVVIEDDDVISLNWESTIYSVPEGEAVEVCIAVEGGELEKTVEFSIISHPGGAQEEDYGVVFLQLSLWPSETKVCFHIETINDDTVEGDETFQLILSSQDPAVTIATPALATINIEDNDVAVFGLEHKNYQVGENLINFTISVLLLEKDIAVPLTLQLSASDITATNGIDYLCSLMEVTFVSGSQPGDIQKFLIPLFSDHIIEFNESFQVQLSTVSQFSIIDSVRAVSTVEIADMSAASIGFEDQEIRTEENASNLKLCLRVHDGELDRPINLSIMTTGSAQASMDYTINKDVTFYPDNNGRISKCLDVTIIDDRIVEADEEFSLILTSSDSSISLSPDTITVVINDNDRVVVAMKQSSYTVSEGNGEVQLTIEIVDGMLEKNTLLYAESRDGNASTHTNDYLPLSTTITFIYGSTIGSVQNVTVELVDDQLVEGLESFTIHISAIDSSLVVSSGREVTTILIVDNDRIDVKLEHGSYSVTEGSTLHVCIVVEEGHIERNRQLNTFSQPDSAQEDDYGVIVEYQTLQPNVMRTCIMVEILDDNLVEGTEIFKLIISSPDPAVVITSPDRTNIEILDNDNARFGFESLNYWLSERPGIVPIPIVLLEHELAVPASVQLTASDVSASWGADYVYQQTPLTFQPGEKAGDTHMVFIDISQDTTIEETETFQLYLSYQNVMPSADDALGMSTIHISDQTTATLGFERAQYLTVENIRHLEVCLVLQDGRELARFVNLAISSRDGTAQASEDYLSLELHTSFGPIDGHRKCLQLTVLDDWRLESNEILTLTLSSPDPSIFLVFDQTVIRIFDDDQVAVSLQQSYYAVEETAGQVNLIVELLGDIERDVSVMLESRDGTATASNGDYLHLLEVITFHHGSSSGSTQSATVYIQDDLLAEQLEFFTVHISSLDAGVQIQHGRDVFVYIISDDVAVTKNTISMPVSNSNSDGNNDSNDDVGEMCTTRRGCTTRSRSRTRSREDSTRSTSRSSSRSRSTRTNRKKGR